MALTSRADLFLGAAFVALFSAPAVLAAASVLAALLTEAAAMSEAAALAVAAALAAAAALVEAAALAAIRPIGGGLLGLKPTSSKSGMASSSRF